jgi:hypothetical protein
LLEICQSKDLLCGIFCSVPHLSVSSPLDVSFIFLGSPFRTIFSTSFSLSIYRSLCIFHRSFCISPNSPVAPPDLSVPSTHLSVSPWDHLVFLVSSSDFQIVRFCPFRLVSSLWISLKLPRILLYRSRICCISLGSLVSHLLSSIDLSVLSPDPTVSLLDLLYLPRGALYCSRISLHFPSGSSIPDHPCISLGFPWIFYPCEFFNFI